jgi:hypothetical protein
MARVRTIFLAFMVLFFAGCSVSEHTPEDVSQKIQEGIKGNGTLVPNENDPASTGPSNNSPVTKPAGATPP